MASKEARLAAEQRALRHKVMGRDCLLVSRGISLMVRCFKMECSDASVTLNTLNDTEWVTYLPIECGRAHELESGRRNIREQHTHLGKLVGDFREVGVTRWLLLEGHNHKVFKELPLLPFEQLQLQCPIAGCALQH